MHTLRSAALIPWAQTDPNLKAQATLALDLSLPVGALDTLSAPTAGPGRSARPLLVPHTQLKAKSMATPEGRAMLVHSIAHIELNAIDLALDVVWRFAGMPEAFYTDWVRIASLYEALAQTTPSPGILRFSRPKLMQEWWACIPNSMNSPPSKKANSKTKLFPLRLKKYMWTKR